MIAECPKYRTTVKCVSITGLVGKMRKEDFMRLENQSFTWVVLQKSAKQKELAINRHLQLKSNVEGQVIKGAVQQPFIVMPQEEAEEREKSPTMSRSPEGRPVTAQKRTIEMNVN